MPSKDFRRPRHIAIIMDGNGRWARERGLPRHMGHHAGVRSVRSTVETCSALGIPYLTLFAFSSENWNRPASEVSLLMDLFLNALEKESKRLQRNNVRLRVVGDRTAFPEALRRRIDEAEDLTASNDGLVLQIAANYGGRWDIVQACQRVARDVIAGRLAPAEIGEQTVAAALSFPDAPDPDLYIRTGGEHRLSNFLLWQAAYAELYFTSTLWPDFDAEALEDALQEFARRERRFGRLPNESGQAGDRKS